VDGGEKVVEVHVATSGTVGASGEEGELFSVEVLFVFV